MSDSPAESTAHVSVRRMPTTELPRYTPVDIEIPQGMLANWQATTNLVAELADVPVALVMRVQADGIEVLVASHTTETVYYPSERAPLGSGLYCETVMARRLPLIVPDSLDDEDWYDNPDVEIGMISYFGLPLTWPDGEVFGTFCLLDSRRNEYATRVRALVERMRDSIQYELAALCEAHNDRKDAAEAHRREQILAAAMDQSPVAMEITDLQGRVEYANGMARQLDRTGGRPLIGRVSSAFAASGYTPQELCTERGSAAELWQGIVPDPATDQRWLRIRIARLVDRADHTRRFVVVREDVTHEQQQARRLLEQAMYDSLTGLPNRALALDRLDQMLIAARRDGHHVGALFLDLDHFKRINDSMGHAEGDRLLQAISARLSSTMRPQDTVGRFGGDEFVILLDHLPHPGAALSVVTNLMREFASSFSMGDREIGVTASVGVALYPQDGGDSATLLRNADTAMYEAKRTGRDNYCFYTPDMNRALTTRLSIEAELRTALTKRELSILFQPIARLEDGAVVGAEVLLRWNNARLGDVPPSEFIPVAEQSGAIIPIGKFVANETMMWLQANRSGLPQGFRVSINLSPRQLRDNRFGTFLVDGLHRRGIPPEMLTLEITEGMLIRKTWNIERAMALFREHSIGLSMDDFGTGYSSLTYLRSYPFTAVKVDQTFIRDLATDPRDLELTRAAIAMAHGLGLPVIAEGVETTEQVGILTSLGCDYAQGFHFGRPSNGRSLLATIHGGTAHP